MAGAYSLGEARARHAVENVPGPTLKVKKGTTRRSRRCPAALSRRGRSVAAAELVGDSAPWHCRPRLLLDGCC